MFISVLLFNKQFSKVMIYAVKTLKSDVICLMLFNVVYNFAETFLKHLKTVLQCLNGDFNIGYKICVICIWGALLMLQNMLPNANLQRLHWDR